MPSTLALCKKYYGTDDVYKLLKITKNSADVDIKKAYYQLSLQVHPDRVSDVHKDEATEKFKIITKIKSVLLDPLRKALYDEKGIIIDDDEPANLDTSINIHLWRRFFKPISDDDVAAFRKKYIGSETEAKSLYESYNKGKGCITYIIENVPFLSTGDEPRITKLIRGWIDGGYLPEFSQFTEESKAKQNRRYAKYGKPNIDKFGLKNTETNFKLPNTFAIAEKTLEAIANGGTTESENVDTNVVNQITNIAMVAKSSGNNLVNIEEKPVKAITYGSKSTPDLENVVENVTIPITNFSTEEEEEDVEVVATCGQSSKVKEFEVNVRVTRSFARKNPGLILSTSSCAITQGKQHPENGKKRCRNDEKSVSNGVEHDDDKENIGKRQATNGDKAVATGNAKKVELRRKTRPAKKSIPSAKVKKPENVENRTTRVTRSKAKKNSDGNRA